MSVGGGKNLDSQNTTHLRSSFQNTMRAVEILARLTAIVHQPAQGSVDQEEHAVAHKSGSGYFFVIHVVTPDGRR